MKKKVSKADKAEDKKAGVKHGMAEERMETMSGTKPAKTVLHSAYRGKG